MNIPKLMKRMISPTFAMAILGLALTSTAAKADDFTFSFTSGTEYSAYEPGVVPGTVTGIIYGLINNSTSSATDVVITSYPAGLESVYPAGPVDASIWDQQFENSFTETSGVITAADFWASMDYSYSQLFLNGENNYNFANLDGNDHLFVWGNDGFANLTFTALSSATTPEPSSLILLATGLAGTASTLRRKFKK